MKRASTLLRTDDLPVPPRIHSNAQISTPVDPLGIQMIEEDVWLEPGEADMVTVPGKPGDELAPGTLNSILKQAGLKP